MEGKSAVSRGKGKGSLIHVSGRQIACDAKDWLKLMPLLRTAANMTANKGTMERCRIPAVAQLSPKISQTGALLLFCCLSRLTLMLQKWGPLCSASRSFFFTALKGHLFTL